ncbi:MAG: carbohydrate hydrolase, partial [Deltaproteobacteria bacterium RBG_13_52_11]
RPNGRAGTRNYVLVIPSVGCSQAVGQAIARGFKDVVCLPNILGCGQVGTDRALVKKTLVGFGTNANVCAVLIVGNGCEQLSPEEIRRGIAPLGKRAEVIVIQGVGGTRKTIALGRRIVKEMREDAARLNREPIPLSELILGTECGGSDYTSGLASNPAIGAACDMLVAEGGTVILAETPELIGAEHLLAKRARTPEMAQQVLDAVSWWENRAIAAGQNIREANPAPGNIAGGITTLEEKSLGCMYKAGTGLLEEVIPYASNPTKKGLVYMDTPAHDIEQLTGMVAGGVQIVLFTTGRGSPIGSPIAPVIKITGNRNTYLKMRDNMDIDVSNILQGKETVRSAGKRIFEAVIAVASGMVTKAEKWGQRDFCVFTMNITI